MAALRRDLSSGHDPVGISIAGDIGESPCQAGTEAGSMGRKPRPKPKEVWSIRTRARHSHRPAAGEPVENIPIACYLPIMPGKLGRGRAERHRSRCPKTKPTQETPHFQSVGFSRMRKDAWRRARQGAHRKRCPNRASGAAAGPGTPARPGLPGSGRDLIVGRSGRNPYREEPWRCRAKSSPAKPIRSPR
jgi:hypothetical protein